MMSEPTAVLLTGASGYLGGSLLVYLLHKFNLRSQNIKLFTLVRKAEQVGKVLELGGDVTPLVGDVQDAEGIKKLVIDNSVSVVLETVDARQFAVAKPFIEALTIVKERLNVPVHFIHTSGAKMFSSHVGVDQSTFLKDDGDVYATMARLDTRHPVMKQFVSLNNQIIDFAENNGVRSYIVAPPMVYGPGTGFGNKVSIQIVALVRVARALGQLYQVDNTDTIWPLMHIDDQVTLYVTVLSNLLRLQAPYGKNGIYFSENGTFGWRSLSLAVINALRNRNSIGIIHKLPVATDEDLIAMGEVLDCNVGMVPVSLAGNCLIRGNNARKLGWAPQHDVEHLMSNVDNEVAFIVKEDSTFVPKAQLVLP
ncbi:NAD-P-binding protein [Lentinula detonsa]|uniref:NAD-P-binding protein n=1 Tax=Lentinula detonsa TaxID=2804962 RepID=A0A9W8TUN3_9AGAR|nr:NAD-P-binding protein [Lentinula detonsa]KAJ3982990.1 NAD-P-binding protein [Lentinula detonsa]